MGILKPITTTAKPRRRAYEKVTIETNFVGFLKIPPTPYERLLATMK